MRLMRRRIILKKATSLAVSHVGRPAREGGGGGGLEVSASLVPVEKSVNRLDILVAMETYCMAGFSVI